MLTCVLNVYFKLAEVVNNNLMYLPNESIADRVHCQGLEQIK